MLKHKNQNGEMFLICQYFELCIEETLLYGDKTLEVIIPKDMPVSEEDYILTKTDEYVIKQIDTQDNGYKILAKLNIDELEGTVFESFYTSEQPLKTAMDLALSGTGWLCECDLKKKRTLKASNVSVWQIIKQAIDTYRVEIKIDSLNKKLLFKEKIGENKGVYFIEELNLISFQIQSHTADFYTEILPIGKDGLTIENINNGNKILCNYNFSNKKKRYIWKDERYVDAESLLEDAKIKLADLAIPYKSYSCRLIDLSKLDQNYIFLSYEIGDIVTIIDKRTKSRIEQRIVSLKRYPESPDKDTCDIANTKLTFEEYAQKYSIACETINNITTDNGTIDGDKVDSIGAEKIINLDEVIAASGKFGELETDILNVGVRLTATEVITGELKTTALTATEADLKYATIGEFNAVSGRIETIENNYLKSTSAIIQTLQTGVADINTLMFGSASGGSIQTSFSNSVIAQLGDAQIKSAMIAEIDAGKITSGSIYTNKINIFGDESGKLSIVDNTIAISDGTRTRVQIGKDASSDYNMYVWDKSGNLMFDALGLTEDGVTRKIIRDDIVKDDANISAEKLNIESLFNVINEDGSHTLKSSKIYVDAANQTLDISFKNMTTSITTVTSTANSANTIANNALASANTANSTINEVKSSTIYEVDVMYALSTSSTTAPTSGWSTKAPAWENGKYMWQKTVTTYGDGTSEETSATCITGAKGDKGDTGTTGATGATGDAGIGVKAVEEQYYLSTSSTAQSGGSWGTAQPAWASGKYIWTRSKITWTDGTITYTTPILAKAINGANSTANTANTTANTASTNANSALSTANTANTNATSALNKANTNATNIATVTETVSTQGTQISTIQGQISSKIWQSDITTAVNNVQVGGRNLLINSATHNFCSSILGGIFTRTLVNDSDALSGKHTEIKCTAAGSGFYSRIYPNVTNGKTYTWSFWGKCSVSKGVNVGHERGGQTSISLTTEWKLFSYTFKANANNYSAFTWYTSWVTGEILYIRDFKFEEGNKATTWTPAPEDTESSITTLSDKYTTLDQSLDGISATVASHTTQIATKADSSTVTKVQSQVTTLEANLDGYKTTVSSTYATQSALTNGLAGKKSKVYHNCSSSGGTAGYFHLAQLVIIGNYANQALKFVISNRNNQETTFWVQFSNVGNKDPGILRFQKTGTANVYIFKAAASTWNIYVKKSEAYDSLAVTDYSIGSYMTDKIHMVWKDTTITSALSWQEAQQLAGQLPIDTTNGGTSGSRAVPTSGALYTTTTIANQTSQKIQWIVQSGTSASDFTITDRLASLTAEYINLNGLVTFSALDTAAQSRITDVESLASSANTTATTANTNAKNALNTNNGLGIKVNYSDFSTANDGELYLCAKDSTTGALSNSNGWVWWNGAKRTVAKTMVNPNNICPFNTVIYMVLRLSSSTATTGTTYLVWYNSGWKYAVLPTPTAVGGTWTWGANDIVLGSFIEPGNETAIVEAQLFTPCKTYQQVTSGTNAYKTANVANSVLADWCYNNNTTYINGGKIYTGTITASQIAANAITAAKIAAGAVTADKISVTDLSALEATIGGFTIGSNSIENGTWGTDNSVLVCTGSIGAKSIGGSASISGWCFTAGSKFGVTKAGALYASSANISGKIITSSGSVGGWTIANSYLCTDCRGDGSNGYYYRTFIQKATSPKTWVFSCQKSSVPSDTPDRFLGMWYVQADGDMHGQNADFAGNVNISNLLSCSNNVELFTNGGSSNIIMHNNYDRKAYIRYDENCRLWFLPHTSSGFDLSCSASLDMTTGTFYTTALGTNSSIRYKENITNLTEDIANRILDIQTYHFDYKEGYGQKDMYGVLAEEVFNIHPNAVLLKDGIPDAVDYTRFIPLLIKKIQMQQKEINNLKNLYAHLIGYANA